MSAVEAGFAVIVRDNVLESRQVRVRIKLRTRGPAKSSYSAAATRPSSECPRIVVRESIIGLHHQIVVGCPLIMVAARSGCRGPDGHSAPVGAGIGPAPQLGEPDENQAATIGRMTCDVRRSMTMLLGDSAPFAHRHNTRSGRRALLWGPPVALRRCGRRLATRRLRRDTNRQIRPDRRRGGHPPDVRRRPGRSDRSAGGRGAAGDPPGAVPAPIAESR